MVHKLFQKEKLRGEWFKRSERVRTFIDMISCGVGLSMAMARCLEVGAMQMHGKPDDGRCSSARDEYRSLRESNQHSGVLSPAEFGKFIADETEKWRNVIRAANMNAGPHRDDIP